MIVALAFAIGVVLGIVVGACLMAYRRGVRQGRRGVTEPPLSQDKLDAVLNQVSPHGRVRYEVMVTDWGPEHGEMRWRWTVWDADRALRLLAVPPATLDVEGGEVPYMLGNAPTRALAEAEANAWLAKQNTERWVA